MKKGVTDWWSLLYVKTYFFFTPGLPLYPAVKIAVKKARMTPIIKAVFIEKAPLFMVIKTVSSSVRTDKN